MKTIVSHLVVSWQAVLRQRQYMQTIGSNPALIAALENAYAAHVHNAVGVALVMGTDNVTPIKTNPPVWPPGLRGAIDEQQTRVWRLRNLIEAVNRASEGGAVEDIEAALSAAVDYADRIHSDLDAQALAERAAALEAEEARQS